MMSCGSVCLVLVGLVVLISACPDPSITQQRVIGKKLAAGAALHELKISVYSRYDMPWSIKQQKISKIEQIQSTANLLHTHEDNLLFEASDNIFQQIERAEMDILGYTTISQSLYLRDSDNCSCSADYNCEPLFANFTQTQQYLSEQTCPFIRELLADGRNTTVKTFIQLYSDLQFNTTTPQEKDTFLLSIMHLLVNQTETNPPVFVSHGTDHSVRVMMYAARNFRIKEVLTGMTQLYGCDPDQSQFVLMLHSLLHDTGYIFTPPAPDYKFLHAVIGSVIVEDLLEQNGGIGRKILQAACGAPSQTLVPDFVKAIRNHNADDQSCLDIDNPSCIADLNALSNKYNYTKGILAPYSDHGIIRRNYTVEVALEDPMGFLIRLDDNLDSDRSRLTPPQRDPYLNLFLLRVYVDGLLREAVVKNDKPLIATSMQTAKDDSQAYVRQFDPTWSYTTPDVSAIVGNITYKSFLYFYSTYILKTLELDNNNDKLTIDLFQEKISNLTYQQHLGGALYQINRLAVSMHSCYLNATTSFLDSVTVDLVPGTKPNVNQSEYPLKDFAQKPTYFNNGTTVNDVLICGDSNGEACKNARYLTLSPEECIFTQPELKEVDPKNNKNETCCDFVALQHLVTDLTFPVDNTLCPYKKVNEKSKFPKWAIAVIVVGGALFIAAVVGVIVVIKRKKTHEQQGLLSQNNGHKAYSE